MVKIVFATRIHRVAFEILRKYGFEVEVYEGGRYPPKEWFREKLIDADALVVTPMHRVDEELLGYGPRLKVVALFGSGYENIDIDACSRRKVCVFREPEAIDRAVAEHVLALVLSLMRKVVEGDRYVREGRWSEGPAPRELLSSSLEGKKIGIVGMGLLGRYVAQLFRRLGLEVMYWSRRRKLDVEENLGLQYVELDDLLAQSDVVIVTVAYTPETHHLIDERRLRKMKSSAILVNVSRGGVVDTNALVKALSEGWIRGAALDVFEEEPLPPDHPLTKLRNVVLTPHIAGYTREAMIETSRSLAEDLVRIFIERKLPKHVLNGDVCASILNAL